jgi:hypothetical protein
MLKSMLSLTLIGLILNLTFSSAAYAQTQTKDEKRTNSIKKILSIIDSKLDGAVEIKLFDKTKVLGQLKIHDDDSLTVVERVNGKTTKIPFSQIKSVQPWTSNKDFAKSILIVGAAIGFLVYFAKGANY